MTMKNVSDSFADMSIRKGKMELTTSGKEKFTLKHATKKLLGGA